MACRNAVIVVLEGEGSIGAEAKLVTAGDVAWLTGGDSGKASEVAIRAMDNPLRALLYAGRPLHEAVVARGPFVMTPRPRLNKPTPTIVRDASVRSRVSENLGALGGRSVRVVSVDDRDRC